MFSPPAEDRNSSLTALAITDVFGNETRQQKMIQMYESEQNSLDTVIVMISDLLLDKINVTEKLQKVFDGFENTGLNPIFVLMGNFTSKSYLSPGGRDLFTNSMNTLASIITSCPRISEKGKFLIVPGNFILIRFNIK